MLASGRYRARAIDSQLGYAETGTEQVAVTFEILEEGDSQGHSITWFGFLTPAASENTIKSLLVCGWSGADLSDLSGIGKNDVELVVEHEVYNGARRARVKWINRPGSGAFVMKHQMTDAQKKGLGQKMKGLVATLRKEEGAGRPREQSRAPGSGPAPADGGYPDDWDGQGCDGL